MVRNFLVVLGVSFAIVAVASAQEKRIEVIPFLGYTASSGVTIRDTDIGDGLVANKITPKSGLSYGFAFNVFMTEGFSLGFNFAEQRSELEAGIRSGGKETFTDMKVNNYHGVFTYNFGDEDEQLRPFMFGGLGATQYRFSPIEGQDVSSNTRFSTTWGGGVKMYFNEHLGFTGQFRWTPTYIRSDPGGVWCSPWYPWSCWVLSDDHYSHQADVTAGLVLRF